MNDLQVDESLYAVLAAGKHLLNALRFIGVDPDEIDTQHDALERVWPTPWAYDVWCSWHACRVALRRAGWDVDDISVDRRTGWRTSATVAPTVP